MVVVVAGGVVNRPCCSDFWMTRCAHLPFKCRSCCGTSGLVDSLCGAKSNRSANEVSLLTRHTLQIDLYRGLYVKKVDSGTGNVIIQRGGSATIDGATTVSLYAQFESMTLACDGTNWHVV